MKTIGLIGGMSWESSAEYYRIVNQAVRSQRGAGASAKCLLWSFDFSEIAALQHAGDWTALTERMIDAARRLETGGADMLLICTNTMHRMAEEVQAAVSVPLLHIADAAGAAIEAQGLTRVGLLGTAFTMEQPFYRERLRERFGLDVVVPDEADRAVVHRVIYEELVNGVIEPASRQAYREIIAHLAGQGAQGVILGCTEIALLVSDADSSVPLFDTTRLHAEAAVAAALAD
ncbi:aspartate/glutamate racemase family protein [Novosphingobium mangrovi (ex Huang et al. 2023)]|uniref:Aspartate/glutamate racemase family protein n=1 Tax=Novosphingobium mangrovi (ex Huang et al. 2023) TaxID=2976432 RepID=A0ABT2I8X4_9SPHN|nr:aspartate/glutamate racemase family protein [Novosphingobium mangrovi (ex Huang et al. 2023)]MCT2401226.1 aspartate/glutamate racemase family protein [Novosphingobium mangrovi (ex Huang et al. 2023)]